MTLLQAAKVQFGLALLAVPLAAGCFFASLGNGMYAMDALSEPLSACDAACRLQMQRLEVISGRWELGFLILIVVAIVLVVTAVWFRYRAGKGVALAEPTFE